jgi:hypothetical protein
MLIVRVTLLKRVMKQAVFDLLAFQGFQAKLFILRTLCSESVSKRIEQKRFATQSFIMMS